MTTSGPAASASTTDVSSATSDGPSLADSIGEMLGDYRTEDVSPEPASTSAAETTSAEPAAGTEAEATDPAAAAGDVAKPDASAETTSDTPTVTAADDADPFADTTPLTFTVNGKQLTNEGIRVFKEGGAVIRPEAVSDIQNRLSERESLFERNRAQSVEHQTLAKAVEWTDTSTNKTYTGPEAAVEMRVGNALLLAENKLLVETLTDPEKLYAVLTTEQVPDGKGGMRERVIVSPQAMARLQTENELAQLKAGTAIREHFKTVLAEASKGAPAPIDFTTEAPKLVAAVAADLKLDASVLTAQDRALLAKQLPFHVKNGQASLEWQELVKDRIQDRTAQKASASKLVSTTAAATKDGLTRMAAAARGVKPVTKLAAPAVQKPTPDPRAQGESDAWDITERAAAAAMRAHA